AAQALRLTIGSVEDLASAAQLCWLARRLGATPFALATAFEHTAAADLAAFASSKLAAAPHFTVAETQPGGVEPWMALVLLARLALAIDGWRGFRQCRRAAHAVRSLLHRDRRAPPPAPQQERGPIQPGDPDELIRSIQRWLDGEQRR